MVLSRKIIPKITIIIPCYNSGNFLIRSVESILGQTFKNFEIIIINDGSTEKITLKILKQFKKNPKIKIINKKMKDYQPLEILVLAYQILNIF